MWALHYMDFGFTRYVTLGVLFTELFLFLQDGDKVKEGSIWKVNGKGTQ